MPESINAQGPGLNRTQTAVRAVFLAIAVLSTLVSLFVMVTVPITIFAWLAFGLVIIAQVVEKRAQGSPRGA